MFITTIFLLLSFISTNDNIYKCKSVDTAKNVEIGDEVTLCLHSLNLHKKVAFKLKVDDYTVISIEDGFSKLVKSKEENSENSSFRRLNMRNLLTENNETNNDDDNNNSRDEDDSSSDESSDEMFKEEFISQIGNVKTKFPSVK